MYKKMERKGGRSVVGEKKEVDSVDRDARSALPSARVSRKRQEYIEVHASI
jgi:hypothetical protein